MDQRLGAELRATGLTAKASTVYAAVLEAGNAFPSKISAKTGLNRSTVYKILGDLKLKGLVTELERGKKLCYQIEDPSRLQSFAKKQIAVAEDRYENAKKLLPELQGLFALLPNKPRVRFFEGSDGILSVYAEHVAEKEPYEMMSYSNVEELMKTLPPRFVKEYLKKKERLSITTRAIFPDTRFSATYNKKLYSGIPKKFHVQTRYVPTDSFPYKADITMFGEKKVSIINFHENTLIGVIIEDPTVAGMMRMGFDLAWKALAPK